MGKRLIVIIFIGCFLVGIDQKQSYADSTLSMNGLRGEYFDNSNLTNLKLSRDDSQIDFNWGLASPDASIDADTFSVRWTGSIIPRYSESYQFYMAADDGVRLWINNQLILDSWMDHAAELTSRQIALTAGTKYDIRVEYYENQGAAVASLQWSSKSQIKEVVPESQLYLPSKANGTGLKGEYYDNVDLTNLKLTRTDAQVEFAWAAESPDPAIEADTFSVRWSGYVVPKYTEEYTFYMSSDDGVRIWVNNQLILDKWEDQANELTSIPIQLTAGQRYEIRVEYFENLGNATSILKWSSASETKTVIPQSALFPPDSVSGTGLKGEYYDNVDLTNLKLTRTDAQVEFAWAAESPDPSIEADTFSVRWSGYVVPRYTEEYTFYMLSDDGVRIWVNNQLILDKWENQANELASVPIRLTANQRYEIRVEYFENTGHATAALKWSSASETKSVISQANLYPSMERDNDNKIKYNYDAQGKVITIKSKTGEMIYYYYDLNGNLLRKEK
ncbi:PA14 domain-containing protein [Paenibacillus sp. ACRRX]|uniref:PA14 domain-containing protein n=1 Tax=Paenibacillus sp. ACRRX TaxID=2918206 RepID=UPI001EF3ECF4|nr:PA14 domain-containing protein [Paenibacillus sp. ACRRX]MCG7410227.1 PA14 domain-containing protein [Paenibacillus sp. ACRRX]